MLALVDSVDGALARMRAVNRFLPWLLAVLLLCLLPLAAANRYQVYMLDYICVMVVLSVGLNIVKGFAGQVTVGHIGLYAIGAYTSAILALNFGFSFWLAMPLAVAVTAAAGAIVGVPSFRLEGAYLALATLGMSESVRIYIHVTPYLGSSDGLSNIPAPGLFGIVLDDHLSYYYVLMPLTVLAVYFSFAILRSGIGRAFMAVREDPVSAAAAGIHVMKYKTLAFVISAVYAGLAGSMFAHMTPGFIHPNNFTIIEMVTLLLMIVLGGIGHIWGGIIGAIVVSIVFDLTRDYYHYQLLLFGLVIVLTVMFMPKGIGGILDRYIVTKRFVAAREAAARAAHAAGEAGEAGRAA